MVLFDMVFLPVDTKAAVSASKQRLSGFIPQTAAMTPAISWKPNFVEAYGAMCVHTVIGLRLLTMDR
ncbi:hypothetical protein [Bradyrhizobium paxllaeri]|uniref:hypothetical protein n=1 Tax=Bradyrhizobium paxllaeri TaxID=190148 RepID=UPI0011472270|nr:hypothetical protein [Bradyrhizobium paxllaeri]